MLYMFLALMSPAAHGSGGLAGMAGGMSGMGTQQLPFLAFVFALLLIGYSIWDLDQLSGPGASGHYSLATARVAPAVAVLVGAAGGLGAAAVSPSVGSSGSYAAAPDAQPVNASTRTGHAGRAVLAPWVATTCRVAMGATMAFMLLIMI